MAISSKRSNES